MSLDLILRIGTKLILPFILLFALYVQFHGDYGPGGGFQAGVIALVTSALGRTPVFPEHGEFAGAVGALTLAAG